MLYPQGHGETGTENGGHKRRNGAGKLICRCRFHMHLLSGRRRIADASLSTSFDKSTPPRYSRVNRAITVPTTGDGSRATKIDSYSGLNDASSIVLPLIDATRFTT